MAEISPGHGAIVLVHLPGWFVVKHITARVGGDISTTETYRFCNFMVAFACGLSALHRSAPVYDRAV